MATREEFVRRCEELGVYFEDDGSSLLIRAPTLLVPIIRTPAPMAFVKRYAHICRVDYNFYEDVKLRLEDAYTLLLEDMSLGIDDPVRMSPPCAMAVMFEHLITI